jgi:outer membrane protein insertion porin family
MKRRLLLLVGLTGWALMIGGQAEEALRIDQRGLVVQLDGVSKRQVDDVKAVVTEQISLTEDRVVTAPLADDMAFFVLQRYLELGFPEAKVDWAIEGGEMRLTVTEGRTYTVGEVTYEGELTVPAEELTPYLLRPTHEKLGKKEDHPPFVQADVETGVGLVKRYLQAQGYLEAVIAEPKFETNKESGEVAVHLIVTQGQRYLVGSVRIDGGLPKQAEREQEIISGLSGQPFSEVKVESARKSISDLYTQIGHFAAVVSAQAEVDKASKGTVPVTFQVVAGPVFRVTEVQVSPDFSKGAERLIRASYRRAVGKVYAPTDLELLHRRLLDTEVFGRLEVTPEQLGEDSLRLLLSGDEAKRITLSAYAGYETFLGPVLGVEARHVNIFDWGDTLRVKAEGTGRGINGGVLWLDPAIFNSAHSLEAELEAQTFTIFDYERRTVSLRTALGRQWNKHLSTSVFAEYSVNTVDTDHPEDRPLLGDLDYRVFNVGATFVADFRDSAVLPTRGWMSSFTLESGLDTLGGEVSYLRSDLILSVYQPLSKKVRVAAHARTTAMQSDEGVEDLPIDLRLFNGGANSVRSFPEREMGAKSAAGTPLGGTLSQVFTVELSYALAANLELAVFGDAGSLSSNDNDIFTHEEDFSFAVGAGIRYKLPIGPLRVDYGYNPDRKEGDPVGALHITFGFPF